jgi:ribosomal protein L7/L12
MPQDMAGWIVVLAALALGYALGRAAGRNAERRDALAAAPATLARTAPAPSPEVLARVQAALAAGKTIEAIKLMREGTGLDLKAAKEAVERIAGGR